MMIRRLNESDRASLVELLSAQAALNLYLLGNLKLIGFDMEDCEFFGDVEQGRVRGVINRYMTGWTVYGESETDWAGLGAIVDAHEVEAGRLQDNPGGVPSFLPFLKRYESSHTAEDCLMELPEGGLRPQKARDGFVIRKATVEDLDILVELFTDAGEMSRTPAGVMRPLESRRVWLATVGDKAVSAALTNAETEELAMIGGVYTKPEWRGNGLCQAICSGLCSELNEIGLQSVLYWEDPAAGHVYTKLGFRPIGIWRSVRLRRR